ncbi:hypothetical protein FRX31_009833 [Thalictrum thalictroides]|uniref:Uncharacterized protein n=1 Tax=Thalictrum thalictroides TaxID=46969 RepID=A0A7J6WVE0_THATH|nr:hypothetical protein FRX31_009833 [Thalictrum thalictroides]
MFGVIEQNSAGALENTFGASQLEITKLQQSVDELRGESRLLKAQVKAQAKDLSQSKRCIEEVTEKKGFANTNQLSALRQELDETKDVILELKNKLILKENVATVAMGVKDASEKSLRLADLRNSKQREWLEDLSRQLESVMQKDLQN